MRNVIISYNIMLYQIDLVMSCSNPFLCRIETVADDEFV